MAATPPFDRRAIPPGFVFSDWRAPDGWRHRRYDWPAEGKPRGSILFLTGKSDFAEKYLEAMAHWHARGFLISGFDWRGQGGSGRIIAGSDVGHLASLDLLVDDLAVFAEVWARDAVGPRIVMGHSMGGHVVLRALAERTLPIDRAVLIAPMLGIAVPRIARLLAFLAGLFGLTMRPIWRRPGAPGRQGRLTASVERYADEAWWLERLGLSLGAPSWGWLHAAYDSMARLNRPGVLERIDGPVLLLEAGRDRIVAGTAIRRAARRLPHGRLVTLDGAHELLREADPVRLAALAAIDAFLDEAR